MNEVVSIEKIIQQKQVLPYFQGIINFYTEDYFSFESLVRMPPDSPSITPDQLFSMAENQGYLPELDKLCICQAIEQFQQQQLAGLLFINILPLSLGKIADFLTVNYPAILKNIVFEISEKYPLNNIDELKEQIKILRRLGALIAIDDLGAGHSGLISWAEIKPDFVKIDRHFIENINNEGIKREFVRSIVEIARGIRCKVIAEGIETIDELETLHSIGIKLGQGYFLHRPEANPPKTFLKKSCFNPLSKASQNIHIRHSETAEAVLETAVSITPDMRSDDVSDKFKQNPQIRCLPIIEDGSPVGMISRTKILEVFSGRYSYPLHGKKPISFFMNSFPIVVSHNESLQDISNKLTTDVNTDLNTDFIITKNNHYCGVGRVSNLLKLLTETQVKHARHSNPLTLMPGNIPINEHIDDLISQQQPFHLAYFDIDHFKPFNDYFGYSYGDEVIKGLADIILGSTSANLDMVGHIGGDDFVVIFRSNNWQEKCKSILQKFKVFSLKFYTKEEIAEQGIWCKDRKGNQDFFELLSLSIGVVNPDIKAHLSHHEVSELASNAKKQAKLQQGNNLFISRRKALHNNLSHTPIH